MRFRFHILVPIICFIFASDEAISLIPAIGSDSFAAGLSGQKSKTSKPTGTVKGYGYVDLGLSVKWATHNLGAETPEEFGDYYAWGEIRLKNNYEWSNYRFSVISDPRYLPEFSKYNVTPPEGKLSITRSEALRLERKLESVDDAAHINWGGSWRMPSHEEWLELKERCIWIWTSVNGHAGYKVISKKNGRSIFLPAAGRVYSTFDDDSNDFGVRGYYWSSSIGVIETGFPFDASYLFFSDDTIFDAGGPRFLGFSVRPVTL